MSGLGAWLPFGRIFKSHIDGEKLLPIGFLTGETQRFLGCRQLGDARNRYRFRGEHLGLVHHGGHRRYGHRPIVGRARRGYIGRQHHYGTAGGGHQRGERLFGAGCMRHPSTAWIRDGGAAFVSPTVFSRSSSVPLCILSKGSGVDAIRRKFRENGGRSWIRTRRNLEALVKTGASKNRK
jgi:hypothetical protein